MEDLDGAVEAARNAVSALPADDAHRAAALANFCGLLEMRYGRFMRLEDLDEAVDAWSEATALPSTPGNPGSAFWPADLGRALHERFERTGSAADSERAMKAFRDTLAVLPAGNPAARSAPETLTPGIPETGKSASASGRP